MLRGQAQPELLRSYNAERQAVASELIAFDREWAAMLSAPLRKEPGGPGVDPAEVQDYFVRHGRYTAGTATRYRLSPSSPAKRSLPASRPKASRSACASMARRSSDSPTPSRCCSSETLAADGRWRLFLFAGRGGQTALRRASPWKRSAAFLETSPDVAADAASQPLRTPPFGFHHRCPKAVFQQGHRTLALEEHAGACCCRRRASLGLRDYEKIFCATPASDIFALREIDREAGCLVLVRPDQYVAEVLPFDGPEGLDRFFAAFMQTRG